MGTKEGTLAKESTLMAESLQEKREQIGAISMKKMFGGYGVFHKGKMFGIIDSRGRAYSKMTDSNKLDFEEYGAPQHGRMPYYAIPDEILNDIQKLLEWGRKALPQLDQYREQIATP